MTEQDSVMDELTREHAKLLRVEDQRNALLDALRVALTTAFCPCCGRDNAEYDSCTADDCPGVAAIEKAEKG